MSTLPSKAWSCTTLAQGVEACAQITGISLEPGQLQDAMKARIAPQSGDMLLNKQNECKHVIYIYIYNLLLYIPMHAMLSEFHLSPYISEGALVCAGILVFNQVGFRSYVSFFIYIYI